MREVADNQFQLRLFMMTRERYDLLHGKWSSTSSWAVWQPYVPGEPPKSGIGDTSILNPDNNPNLLAALNPDVVLVGLNMASRFVSPARPWGNFHDSSPVANDFKIRFALQGTEYWGAYMTDVFVDLPETQSAVVKRWITENPQRVVEQLNRFEEELADLGSADPLIVAFGGAAHEALVDRFGSTRSIVKVHHYAHYISKEKYREHTLGVLASAGSGATQQHMNTTQGD